MGELYGGGVVFWLDQTGQHGLVCNMIDLSYGQMWSNITSTLIGATAESEWDGQGNTNAIIGQSGHTDSAAKLCDDYTNTDYGTGVYSDWYLPAVDQLSLMYHAKYQVNKTLDSDGNSETKALTKGNYWSSTELNTTYAFSYIMYAGYAYYDLKNHTYCVRAVRDF
jgi:hypothetical protein